MSARHATAPYPVAEGKDGSIYHRYNFTSGRNGTPEVLTLGGWQPESLANYASHIPITVVPDCSPVMPREAIQRPAANDATFARPAQDPVFAELSAIRHTFETQSERAASMRASAAIVAGPKAAEETLEQKSARLDAFVVKHNEAVAHERSKAESFLRTHFKPAGPWVADHIYGKEETAPTAGL